MRTHTGELATEGDGVFTAGRSDCDLCVENVLAAIAESVINLFKHQAAPRTTSQWDLL